VTSLPGNFAHGLGLYADPEGRIIRISMYCPLPINNVDLGTSSNDNDMSSFTVSYYDIDGTSQNLVMQVELMEVTIVNGQNVNKSLCGWTSNDPPGVLASGFASSTLPCVVDLKAAAFYRFDVHFINDRLALPVSQVALSFIGIRFP
jgi:hypothetical protein